MREILFRGKCIETGRNKDKWLYGYLGADEPDEVFVAPIQEGGSALVGYYCDSSTIGQYTGLTDKNGNKIFEGDIVNWDSREWGGPYKELVKWSYELLNMRTSDWHEWCEVIGNIHDNPELLGVE